MNSHTYKLIELTFYCLDMLNHTHYSLFVQTFTEKVPVVSTVMCVSVKPAAANKLICCAVSVLSSLHAG